MGLSSKSSSRIPPPVAALVAATAGTGSAAAVPACMPSATPVVAAAVALMALRRERCAFSSPECMETSTPLKWCWMRHSWGMQT